MKSFLTISAVVILVLAVLTPQASACKYGCTPGYWKNHIEAWPSAITTTETLGENFNVGFFGNVTFSDALAFHGGSDIDGAKQILLRAGAAALLNSYKFGSNFISPSTVINLVNTALASGNRQTILNAASYLDGLNNTGCPL